MRFGIECEGDMERPTFKSDILAFPAGHDGRIMHDDEDRGWAATKL
jgi:hypothetical protein